MSGAHNLAPGLGEGSPNGEDSLVLGLRISMSPAQGGGEGSPNGEDSWLLGEELYLKNTYI